MNANVMGWIIYLLIGLVAGFLASIVVKGRGLGLIGDMIVGVIGALLGGWLFGAFFSSLAGGGMTGSILTAFVGAVILLAIIKLAKSA
ncbi:MAG TPA: GlsB/YeaQ/YmgE family stress response membrane protein [Pyrinomonadaceae bacterium]|nr:GlsB/YeaQ/YmgE family stress response membrane protein [Pyrinomonadaceae bacterium]